MDQTQEILSLKARVAKLEALIGAPVDEPKPRPVALVADDEPRIYTGAEAAAAGFPGVTYPGSDFVAPTEAELTRLYQIALAACPQLGPKAGTSLEHSSEHFSDFRFAFRYIGALYRAPKIDTRRGALSWCCEYDAWAGRAGPITTQAFMLATVAHGDVEGLLTPEHLPGSCFALHAYTGTPAVAGWRAVLKAGRPTGLVKVGAYSRAGQLEAVPPGAAA